MAHFAGLASKLQNLKEQPNCHSDVGGNSYAKMLFRQPSTIIRQLKNMTTHSDKLKGQFSYNKKQVLWLTDMTEQEYHDFQTDTAKAWADRNWADVYNTDNLIVTNTFWGWWKYNWNKADDDCIIAVLYTIQSNARFTRYRELHQYVFNTACVEQQYLLADFKSLRRQIDVELKHGFPT